MTLQPGAYDPRFMKPATLCRCGHILECCADCIGWLREESPRIEREWRGLMFWMTARGYPIWLGMAAADTAEADDLAYYMAVR